MMGWRLGWKDVLAILVHDLGYFGLHDLSNVGSRKHVTTGAYIMYRLGYPIRDMVLHSGEIARMYNRPMSKLGIADKLAMSLENDLFYAIRAWLARESRHYYTGKRVPGEDDTIAGIIRFKKRAEVEAVNRAYRDIRLMA